jgi:hypothetical protein
MSTNWITIILTRNWIKLKIAYPGLPPPSIIRTICNGVQCINRGGSKMKTESDFESAHLSLLRIQKKVSFLQNSTVDTVPDFKCLPVAVAILFRTFQLYCYYCAVCVRDLDFCTPSVYIHTHTHTRVCVCAVISGLRLHVIFHTVARSFIKFSYN